MTDFPTIAFISLPLLAGTIGVGLGYWFGIAPTDNEMDAACWEAMADVERERADENHRKFIEACKECNALDDSNHRLSSQNKALRNRLIRIVEAFAGQKSGTAQKAVKLALGDA